MTFLCLSGTSGWAKIIQDMKSYLLNIYFHWLLGCLDFLRLYWPLPLSSSPLWLKWPSFIVNCHLQSVFRWRDSRNVFPNARSQNIPNVRSREKVANTWYCIVCVLYCCISQGLNETGLLYQISTALFFQWTCTFWNLGEKCGKVMCLFVPLVPALDWIWDMA